MPRKKSTPKQWAAEFNNYGELEQLSTTIMEAGDMITPAAAMWPIESEWDNFRTIPTQFVNAAVASAGTVAEIDNTIFSDYARHDFGEQAHAIQIPNGYILDEQRGILVPEGAQEFLARRERDNLASRRHNAIQAQRLLEEYGHLVQGGMSLDQLRRAAGGG